MKRESRSQAKKTAIGRVQLAPVETHRMREKEEKNEVDKDVNIWNSAVPTLSRLLYTEKTHNVNTASKNILVEGQRLRVLGRTTPQLK